MDAMPRPRPPYLHRETTRHGSAVWYVRVGKGPRIRLRAEFGSPDFDAEYRAAILGEAPAAKAEAPPGTLAWLIDRYREVEAWSSLLGHALAARKHFQARPRERRREPFSNHVRPIGRSRTARKNAISGPTFPGGNARAVQMGPRRNTLKATRLSA